MNFCINLLKVKYNFRVLTFLSTLTLSLLSPAVYAEGLSANFKNTDIQEFINTVSKNLDKTIIIDPSVKGAISVRSYEEMDNQQYYQFFLSVLNVYGYAVMTTPSGAIKVIPERDAKSAGVPLITGDQIADSDEIIVRITPLHNVSGRELAPLLRQLNNAAEGSIIHYDPANVILMTGRATVVNHLVTLIESVDAQADFQVETLHLNNASAAEVATLAASLHGNPGGGNAPGGRVYATVVADDRTNSVLVTGDEQSRASMIRTLKKLDQQRGTSQSGNTRVIYLEYAKAKNLLNVLNGITNTKPVIADQNSPVVINSGASSELTIKADEETNALIITGPQYALKDMESVIAKLDIRRAQVLVEAVIVEVSDAEGVNFGIQWMNTHGGGTNYASTGSSVTAVADKGMVNSLAGVSGLAAGFYRGNWAGLLTALQTNSQNNILATPSIVTLDNIEAEFTVGQEVPVLTGSQTTSGDNVYNTVERKSVGIKLKVTPQINKGDSVMLTIEQEVSSVSETGISSELGPTFDTRLVRNAVLVGTGNTVVVGGLLDTSNNNSNNKVPILGNIPILKYLFGATTKKVTKRNLMLFIRPTIIREQDEYSRISQQSRSKFNQQDLKSVTDQKIQQSVDEETGLYGVGNGLDQVLVSINAFYSGRPR